MCTQVGVGYFTKDVTTVDRHATQHELQSDCGSSKFTHCIIEYCMLLKTFSVIYLIAEVSYKDRSI